MNSVPDNNRRWFQFHLSTAVVLMFVAGGLIGLNVRPRLLPESPNISAGFYSATYGWPFEAFTQWFVTGEIFQSHHNWGSLLADLLIALTIIVSVATILEWRIRRKPAEPSKRRWFQFDLSTAVMVMFVAGALTWVNLTPTKQNIEPSQPGKRPVLTFFWLYSYGWPCAAWRVVEEKRVVDQKTFMTESRWMPVGWLPIGLTVDGITAFSILIFTAVLLEWLIRRKSAKP